MSFTEGTYYTRKGELDSTCIQVMLHKLIIIRHMNCTQSGLVLLIHEELTLLGVLSVSARKSSRDMRSSLISGTARGEAAGGCRSFTALGIVLERFFRM